MHRSPAIYILSNTPHGTLYTGVPNDLATRSGQDKNRRTQGFTCGYNLTQLVYCALCDTMYEALSRGQQIKAGSRAATVRLIDRLNSEWKALDRDILG